MREREDDAVEDLRTGGDVRGDVHVDIGLANPALYSLTHDDPRPGASPPAAVVAAEVLAGKIRRIAEAGRPRAAEERAADLVHATACGTLLTPIG